MGNCQSKKGATALQGPSAFRSPDEPSAEAGNQRQDNEENSSTSNTNTGRSAPRSAPPKREDEIPDKQFPSAPSRQQQEIRISSDSGKKVNLVSQQQLTSLSSSNVSAPSSLSSPNREPQGKFGSSQAQSVLPVQVVSSSDNDDAMYVGTPVLDPYEEESTSTKSSFDHKIKARAGRIFANMQRGLVYTAPHNCFIIYGKKSSNYESFAKALSREELGKIMTDLREEINNSFGNSHTSIVVGVSLHLWVAWSKIENNKNLLPSGMKFQSPVNEIDDHHDYYVPKVFQNSATVYSNSGGPLFFTVKSDSKENVKKVKDILQKEMEQRNLQASMEPEFTSSRESKVLSSDDPNSDEKDGRLLGCRFSESLQNLSSPIEVLDQALVGGSVVSGSSGNALALEPNEDHHGASFAVIQRFTLNWDALHAVGNTAIEDMVGRKQYTDEFLQSPEPNSHIKCSHVADDNGDAIRILRLSQPFGSSERAKNPDNRLLGHTPSDEKGIFFVGLSQAANRLETILRSQTGFVPGFFRDRLLNSAVLATTGGIYYMPSRKDLNMSSCDHSKSYILSSVQLDSGMKRFPGIDWSRLPRHFLINKKNSNPYMHYNHHEYMYRMSTATTELSKEINPPSTRILLLAARVFSRWQDSWYTGREQQPMNGLFSYAKEFFEKYITEAKKILLEEKNKNYASSINALKKDELVSAAVESLKCASIVTRKAWAVRLACGHVFVSDSYGCRGAINRQEVEKDETGQTKLRYGADTFHIHPLEVIVGAMPNLSLGSGKFFIDYAIEKEEWPNFLSGFSYVSGVGHIVPGYDHVLNNGTKLVREELLNKQKASNNDEFYNASIIALLGVEEHLQAYHSLVKKDLDELGRDAGNSPEVENLTILSKMLKHLGKGGAPRNFREAAQMIFTLHSCLHLIGEPVAVGRLDQMLEPFIDTVSPHEAQEIVDAFFLKMSEKTVLNRQYFVDHQPPGHLAMGNASGPYPQGANLNQWVQQLTIGGQDENGGPAYNTCTILCLRASRRLHLNAPVLSLRLYNMKQKNRQFLEVIEEAAKALLSGGAMPVLLNDDKIIPGLQKSAVWTKSPPHDESSSKSGTGIAESNSSILQPPKVAIEHARNYACDGCYEPMFVGRNWFQLGGFPVLQALEYALNQGRDMLSAGPVFLEGKVASFRSKPVEDIDSYHELEKLFFDHFEWTYAKQAAGFVEKFGSLAQTCPAPLLSIFIEGCMEKALDLYAGGATYSVVGPCFTGVPDVINSLWAIQKLCFTNESDVEGCIVSLPELVCCLKCNWGEDMIDPKFMPRLGEARLKKAADRFRMLRKMALSLPRYGRGNREVDEFGNKICKEISERAYKLFADAPIKFTGLKQSFRELSGKHPGMGIVCLQPGIGTFEGYLNNGMTCAASADGRLRSSTLATDLSPAPTPTDLPMEPESSTQYGNAAGIISSMEGMSGSSAVFWNGSPVDKNISEDFDKGALKSVIEAFANGVGSNTMTITVANESTFQAAVEQPERYDTIRVRMGGWTEFFCCLPETHKQIHIRRPRDLNDVSNAITTTLPDVVISKAIINPKNNENGGELGNETVTLTNYGDSSADISNWKIAGNNGDQTNNYYQLEESTILGARESYTFTLINNGNGIPSLANGGGSIKLYNDNNDLVNIQEYSKQRHENQAVEFSRS